MLPAKAVAIARDVVIIVESLSAKVAKAELVESCTLYDESPPAEIHVSVGVVDMPEARLAGEDGVGADKAFKVAKVHERGADPV